MGTFLCEDTSSDILHRITKIEAFYREMKDTPLPEAVERFKNIIDSRAEETLGTQYEVILSKLAYDFRKTDSEGKCVFEDWSKVNNKFYFAPGYKGIFSNEPIIALWVAYISLELLFAVYKDYHAGYIQVFNYGETIFWIILEDDHVLFAIPDELLWRDVDD